MANKKGHWYTDKNGNHYFVEEGQTPQEGWEASKRRKMIDGGKYKVSEDGNEYTDVTEDEYNKYEADETDFDETIEDDFGFDEYSDDEVMEYLENYDYTGNESLDDIKTLAREYDPNITDRDAEIMAQKILESGRVGNNQDDFYSPDNITKRHQNIEDAFEMPKEEGWEPSDFGEKSFIKNKDKDNEMFIQYNGADYDGNNQEWVAGYMKDGEYVNKKFASMEEAKEFLDNADQGEDKRPQMNNSGSQSSDNLDPNNPKYKGFGPSRITNAKLVDEGYEFTDADTGEKRKESIIEYIPYGSLVDGDNRRLYALVNNYDGTDTPKTGAIVAHSLEDAKDQLERQTQLGIQGRDRYLKRGQYDEDYFNLVRDNREPGDDETYKERYGWDFNKPFAEHDFMKNDPYEKWKSDREAAKANDKDDKTESVKINSWLKSQGISPDSNLAKGLTPENKKFILELMKNKGK